MKQLMASTRTVDGRVECDALWRRNEPQLPNNRSYAMTRLLSLEASPSMKKPEIRKAFNDGIKGWIDSGYVRKVTDPKEQWPKNAYYLPIFVVCRPDKS